jgi:hypothetical protein
MWRAQLVLHWLGTILQSRTWFQEETAASRLGQVLDGDKSLIELRLLHVNAPELLGICIERQSQFKRLLACSFNLDL